MRERAALAAATVVAIALVLSACDSKPDPTPAAPSLDGTWVFTGFAATIAE